jgi:hypothetical protein
MTNTQRAMTSASVKAIMQKRITIPAEAVGENVKLRIQGNGNVIDVKTKEGEVVESITEPGTVLQKKLFNFKANSGVALQNARNRQLIIDGIKAEKAGETEKASELFNDYLNATQLSVGILLPSRVADQLRDGVLISADITRIDTDNGSLLTVDPSTICVLEAKSYGTTTFNLDDFSEGEEEKAEAPAAAEATQA